MPAAIDAFGFDYDKNVGLVIAGGANTSYQKIDTIYAIKVWTLNSQIIEEVVYAAVTFIGRSDD